MKESLNFKGDTFGVSLQTVDKRPFNEKPQLT